MLVTDVYCDLILGLACSQLSETVLRHRGALSDKKQTNRIIQTPNVSFEIVLAR